MPTKDENEIINHQLETSGVYYKSRNPFTMIPNNFIRNRNINYKHKMMFMELMAFAGANDNIFPGKETLIKETGMNKETVKKVLEELEEMNTIIIVRRKYKDNGDASHRYILTQIDDYGDFDTDYLYDERFDKWRDTIETAVRKKDAKQEAETFKKEFEKRQKEIRKNRDY